MRTNADMTLYKRAVTNGAETFTVKHFVIGVHWQDNRAGERTVNGTMRRDDITVYIPLARGVAPVAGDVIVKGLVTDVIGQSLTITGLRAKYPGRVAVVRSVAKNDYGTGSLAHYRVGAQ